MEASRDLAAPVKPAGGEPSAADGGPGDFLTIDTGQASGQAVVTLRGELSAYTTPVLRSVLGEINTSRLVIDLRELDRIDASGLSFLVSVTENRSDHGALTGLVAEGGLHRLFGYTRLVRTAPLADTVDHALGAMPGTGP